MANLKELRGRIKSVASIAQITGAMEMAARPTSMLLSRSPRERTCAQSTRTPCTHATVRAESARDRGGTILG